jgi:multidrug efflux pump subunit AcrA (membrane-fusion protein)
VPVGAVSLGKVSVRSKDGGIEQRNVGTGRSDGQMIEIRSGLAAGDEVLQTPRK